MFARKILESKWARYTSLHSYVAYSVHRSTLIKLRILVEWVARSLITSPLTRSKCRKITKQFAGKGTGLEALLIANGPSVKRLEIDALTKLQKQFLKIIAVNFFATSSLGANLIPDFYCLTDPRTKPTNSDIDVLQLWQALDAWEKVVIVVPQSWYKSISSRSDFSRFVFMDDRSLELFSRNISPQRSRGYCSMTAYKALAFANYMNFEQIHVIGVDNSMFLNVAVDENNALLEGSLHFYSNKEELKPKRGDLDLHYPSGMQDYLNAHARLFFDLNRCFKKLNVQNLDEFSLVQTFPKRSKLKDTLLKQSEHVT